MKMCSLLVKTVCCLCVMSVLLPLGILIAADPTVATWPQFRGINSDGAAVATTRYPIQFGPATNVHWSLELPTGHSSPVIWGNHLFLTAFQKESQKLEVISIRRDTGDIRWRRVIEAETIEKGHPAFNPASSTTATNGKYVAAYFGSAGLFCFDVDGNQKWHVPMPTSKTYGGNATSPIIWNDRVILYRGTYLDHYLLSVAVETGEEIWKHEFPDRFGPADSSTPTPLRWQNEIIIHFTHGVRGHAFADGATVWDLRANTTATSTPVIAGERLLVATWNQTGEPDLVPEQPPYSTLLEDNDGNQDGVLNPQELPKNLAVFHRPEGAEAQQTKMPISFRMLDGNRDGQVDELEWEKLRQRLGDRESRIREHGLLSIQLGQQGVLTDDHVQVLERKAIPEVPSPVYLDGCIYMVKNGGIVTAIDVSDGSRVFRKRLGSPGTHYASPIVGEKLIYLTSASGEISVIDVSGETPKRLARNAFNEEIMATPALVENTLYVRTTSRLYAFKAE